MKISTCLAILTATVASVPSHAEFEFDLDLRWVDSDGRKSFLNEGLGKLRFDANDDGLQLGRVRAAYRGSPFGNWHVVLDTSIWSTDDHNVLDVVEAYAEWRPVPTNAWRSKAKVGAFYAPISLEHRARGWTNPYTISSSALNTWVGEELRTIGVSYALDHLGIADGGSLDAGVEAAVFGWNDPAGVIVAFRGFALHDRQTPLWGRVGTYAPGNLPRQRVIFKEIDNRPGYHVGGHVKHASGLELRALHYDNRGDPAAYHPGIQDYAWDTRFQSVGMRYDLPSQTTLIAQTLNGVTDIGPGARDRWKYAASFLMVTQDWNRWRLAARWDDFNMQQIRTVFRGGLGREEGNAYTLAATAKIRDNVELIAEWMLVDSTYTWRRRIGEDPQAEERSLQLALRWAF